MAAKTALSAIRDGMQVSRQVPDFELVLAARVIKKLQSLLAEELEERISAGDLTITAWARKLELSPQLLRAILRKPAAKPPPGGWPKRTTLRPAGLPGVSVPVAARKLGISPTTAYAWVRSGKLRSEAVPKTYRDGVWLRVLLDE